MEEEKLSVEYRYLIERYLQSWLDRRLKFALGSVGLLLALTGMSVYTTARNVASAAADSKLSTFNSLMARAVEVSRDAELIAQDLKERQDLVEAAIAGTERKVGDLSERSVVLTQSLEDADRIVKAVEDLSNTHDEIVDRLLASATFKSALVDRIYAEIAPFPSGTIVPWYSKNGKGLPNGWVFCDGRNGTPDLTNKFILGVSVGSQVGERGGKNSIIIPSENIVLAGSTGSSDRSAVAAGISPGGIVSFVTREELLEVLNGKISDVDDSLEKLKRRLLEESDRISELYGEVGIFSTKILELEEGLGKLKVRVRRLEGAAFPPPPTTTERAPTTDVAPATVPVGPHSIQELQAETEARYYYLNRVVNLEERRLDNRPEYVKLVYIMKI